jgi:hypothetical protein
VPVDHINIEAIDHLAGVISDHRASIHVARSEKVHHTHGWSQFTAFVPPMETTVAGGVRWVSGKPGITRAAAGDSEALF